MDAIASPDTVTFDFRTLSARDRYKLMIGTVVPRPIALVTTVDPEGRINAAPFSFFNCLSADPPILALGVENHPDMSFKDTARNVRLTEVFNRQYRLACDRRGDACLRGPLRRRTG